MKMVWATAFATRIISRPISHFCSTVVLHCCQCWTYYC